MIEQTNRVLIGHGTWDGRLILDGTLLSIQNMTWNGYLGFQRKPSQDFIVPIPNPKYAEQQGIEGAPPSAEAAKQGVMGRRHYERGLMWVESYQNGHLQPQYQPRVALRQLEWLLGRIDQL